MLSARNDRGRRRLVAGEYIDRREVWEAFKLPGSAARRSGVYENQPSPFGGNAGSIWGAFAGAVPLILAGVAACILTLRRQQEVVPAAPTVSRRAGRSVLRHQRVRAQRAALRTSRSQSDRRRQQLGLLNFALINEDTGQAYDFGAGGQLLSRQRQRRQLERGQPQRPRAIPARPPGRYYLRVEPEMDANASREHYLRPGGAARCARTGAFSGSRRCC